MERGHSLKLKGADKLQIRKANKRHWCHGLQRTRALESIKFKNLDSLTHYMHVLGCLPNISQIQFPHLQSVPTLPYTLWLTSPNSFYLS